MKSCLHGHPYQDFQVAPAVLRTVTLTTEQFACFEDMKIKVKIYPEEC